MKKEDGNSILDYYWLEIRTFAVLNFYWPNDFWFGGNNFWLYKLDCYSLTGSRVAVLNFYWPNCPGLVGITPGRLPAVSGYVSFPEKIRVH